MEVKKEDIEDLTKLSKEELIEYINRLKQDHEGRVIKLKKGIEELWPSKTLDEYNQASPAMASLDLDVTSLTVEQPVIKDPLLIPEILNNILSRLDEKEMRVVRLVSKFWNETWIANVCKDASQCFELDAFDKDSIPDFYSLLQNSLHPEVFMNSVRSDGNIEDPPEMKRLMIEFGWAVKTLECTVTPLTCRVDEWQELCPNLEELNLNWRMYNELLKSNQQLRPLKRLTFNIGTVDPMKDYYCGILTMLLKASPHLQYLQIATTGYSIFGIAMFECLFILLEFPEVTRNLRELSIKTPGIGPLHNAVQIELVFGLRQRFVKVLENASDSLVTLSIQNIKCFGNHSQSISDNRNALAIPEMSVLKVFEYYADSDLELGLADLTKMPKLEILVLAECTNRFLPSTKLDTMFSVVMKPKMKPHLTVKELTFYGSFKSSNTPTLINVAFPNISKLIIGVGYKYMSAEGPAYLAESWFNEAFQGFSQMQNIRSLTLYFDSFEWNEDIDLHTAFSQLKDMKNLRHLTLINTRDEPPGSAFEHAIISILLECTQLISLKLIKFTITLSTPSGFIEAVNRSSTRVQFLSAYPFSNFVN